MDRKLLIHIPTGVYGVYKDPAINWNYQSEHESQCNGRAVQNGRRCSAAVAYLKPALGRANLSLRVNALVEKILCQNHRAVGVRYTVGGRRMVADRRRRVRIQHLGSGRNGVRQRRCAASQCE